MSGRAWFERLHGETPIHTLPAVSYVSALLARQKYPVTLEPTWMWLGDSLTDLVAGVTLANTGVTLELVQDERVFQQSPLARGLFRFNSTSDKLEAPTSDVEDFTGSGLVIRCIRVPATPGLTMGVVNKRGLVDPFKGNEFGVNASGQFTATLDSGPASSIVSLVLNSTAEQPDGTWHVAAMLVDKSKGSPGQWQIATQREASLFTVLPGTGDISTTTLMSIGAGRLQSLAMSVLFEIAFMGPQVEGLFHDSTQAASATNDPTGRTVQDNVCAILADDTVRGQVFAPYS